MNFGAPTAERQPYYPPMMQVYGVEIPTRCFIGGLPYSMTELELNAFFSQFGCVKDSKIVTDRNGVSKGYGFVTYETEGEAASVCAKGTLYYKEKKLNISKAIRRQGGQYCKANQEYVNGQRLIYQSVNGYLVAQKNGSWVMEEPSPYCQPAKPFFQIISPPPMYVGGGSQAPYIQSPVTPVTPNCAYYPTLPSPSGPYEPFPAESGHVLYPMEQQLPSPPVQLVSPPMQFPSHPIQLSSPPGHLPSRLAHLSSPPVQLLSRPIQLSSPPVQLPSCPVQLFSPPLQVLSPVHYGPQENRDTQSLSLGEQKERQKEKKMVKEEEKEEKVVEVEIEVKEEEEEEEEGNGREHTKNEDQKSQKMQPLSLKSPQLEEEMVKCSLTALRVDSDELKNVSAIQSNAHSPACKSRSPASLPQEIVLQQADNCPQAPPNVFVNY